MSIYTQITELVEEAIFHKQARNANEVIKHIRRNSDLRSLDRNEIDRLIHIVATQYKRAKNGAE